MNKTETNQDLWTVKVRRRLGGFSIIDVTDRGSATALVEELNDRHGSDIYYTESYSSEEEYGAHSHNRK